MVVVLDFPAGYSIRAKVRIECPSPGIEHIPVWGIIATAEAVFIVQIGLWAMVFMGDAICEALKACSPEPFAWSTNFQVKKAESLRIS